MSDNAAGDNVTTLANFRAGPLCGGKTLQPLAVRREIIVPIAMNKLLIFVVDLTSCRLIDDDPRQVEEMKEDIQDAMGVTSEGKVLQVIFAGYDGPQRSEIHEDKDLNTFFAKFGLAKGLVDNERGSSEEQYQRAEVEAKRKELAINNAKLLGMTTTQLSQLRLGGLITKIQMRKYIRLLGETKDKNAELEVENLDKSIEIQELTESLVKLEQAHKELTEEHQSVVESIPGQIEMAVTLALNEARNKWTVEQNILLKKIERENQVAMMQQAEKLKKEMKQEVAKIQKKSRQAIAEAEEQRDKVQILLDDMTKKFHEAEDELKTVKELMAQEEDRQNKLDSLQAQFDSCRTQLDECIVLLEENGIPLPGRMIKDDEKIFKWHVSKVSAKLNNYQKDHAIQSPEFTLWGLKGLQVEFFPNGTQGSYPGWTALKLRIPRLHAVEGKTNRIKLRWKVVIGSLVLGPRRDEFCDDYWWCRKGTVTWPNFAKQYTLKKQIDDSKDALSLVVELCEASVQLVDSTEKVKPPSKTKSVPGLKLLPELTHTKGDRDVIISWRGKIVDDSHLLEMVSAYIVNSFSATVHAQKNFGSIRVDSKCSTRATDQSRPGTCNTLSPTRNNTMSRTLPMGFELESDCMHSGRSQFQGSRMSTPLGGQNSSPLRSPQSKRHGGSFFRGPWSDDDDDKLFGRSSPLGKRDRKGSRKTSPMPLPLRRAQTPQIED
eukprot:GEMP01013466.1.p1 GENE.GEMP01013466.1~~GEMP01013466.1.p1  ORF type:complete len:716 (+),score=154.76 GEMP01013466.1:521-2668(+)